MTHTCRRATPKDGQACARIIIEWGSETPWIGPLDEFESMAAWWSGCIEHASTAWVGQSEGEVTGFCVREDDNITGLYLAQRARGVGLGKRLLDLAKQDRDWITVWAYEKNHRARKFYRREGCTEISREVEDRSGLVDIEHRWTRQA